MTKKTNIIPFRLFEGIEKESRLTDKVSEILNKQIKNELQSSQIYRGISCWLDDEGWPGACKYYVKSAQEELKHMEKVYEFMFDRNAVAKVPNTEDVKQEFESIREVLEDSLTHEIEVTTQWEEISSVALEDKDNTTYEFAQWFLKEQREEENKFRDLLDKMNLDIPKWELDEEFGKI